MKMNIKNIEFNVCDNDTIDGRLWTTDIPSGYGSQEFDFIKESINACSVFVDVGAHIGAMTLFAAKLYDKVYSFEINQRLFEMLNYNVALNDFTNVETRHVAIYNTDGKVTIGIGGTPDGEEKLEFDSITLRTFFKEKDIKPRTAFIKIDIEGGEYCLFEDEEFYSYYQPTIQVEKHPWVLPREKQEKFDSDINKLRKYYNMFNMGGHIRMLPKE